MIVVACMFMHGSSEQRLEFCLNVSCRSALFVPSSHTYTVSACYLSILLLLHYDPAVSKSIMGIVEHDPQT